MPQFFELDCYFELIELIEATTVDYQRLNAVQLVSNDWTGKELLRVRDVGCIGEMIWLAGECQLAGQRFIADVNNELLDLNEVHQSTESFRYQTRIRSLVQRQLSENQ